MNMHTNWMDVAVMTLAQSVGGGGSAGDSGGSSLSNLLMMAGVVLALLVVMTSMRRKLRHQEPAMKPSERIAELKQTHEMSGDLRQMMVELEDLTRRFGAQLDAKALRLERLMAEADERIARLEKGSSAEAGAGQGSAAREPAEPVDPLAEAVYRLADQGRKPVEIARQLDEQVGKVELILALRQ
jgi:hypothetical protein